MTYITESRDLGASRFRFAPNKRSPVGHRHREQEEAYVVVDDARSKLAPTGWS